MITIYTIAYNEAFMLPYFVSFYRIKFPKCRIVVYDNFSTDNTADIALKLGCEVHRYDTNGKLDDLTYLTIKNNCWKSADTDWVAVVDVDELLEDIHQGDLIDLENEGATIARFEGYNMVNMADNMNITGIKHGVRAKDYDKSYLFNRSKITDINYGPGCHWCNPVGEVQYSANVYRCYHYKYINADYMIRRHKAFAQRLSDENKRKGYGGHYLNSGQQIRNEFNNARQQAVKLF